MNVNTKERPRSVHIYALPVLCLIFALVLGAGCKDRQLYDEQPPQNEEPTQ